MKNLSNPEYCDKLIILTSKIMKKYLKPKMIKYLIDKKEIKYNNIKKNNFTFINKQKISDLDINNDTLKNKLCIGISKHYIQIAHIFSAIATTLNPESEFINLNTNENSNKNTNKNNNYEIDELINKNNLCSNRIKILLNGINYSDAKSFKKFNINPNICNKNCDKYKCEKPSDETFENLPGVPELKQLYYDMYDYNYGKFNKMSLKMEKIYRRMFYIYIKFLERIIIII